jgi:hypothetical protein
MAAGTEIKDLTDVSSSVNASAVVPCSADGSTANSGRCTAASIANRATAYTFRADYRVYNPTSADDIPITTLIAASTLTSFRGTCVGGTSITLTLQYCDADGVSNCAALVNEDTITCGTAKNFTLNATAIPTGVKTLRVLAGTVTGAVTYVLATAQGTTP